MLALKNCFAHAHSVHFLCCRSRLINDVKFWSVLQLRGWRKRWQLFCFNAPLGYTNWISGWLRHILQVKRLGTIEKCLQKCKVIFLDDVLVILTSISTLFNFPIIHWKRDKQRIYFLNTIGERGLTLVNQPLPPTKGQRFLNGFITLESDIRWGHKTHSLKYQRTCPNTKTWTHK